MWKENIYEEMEVLIKNQTQELIELPQDKIIVDCRWVFTKKYNPNRSVNKRDGLLQKVSLKS